MRRDVATSILDGGVRSNLPEITWLESYSTVTDRYLFLCLFKHGYHNFLCVRQSSRFIVVELVKAYQMKVLKRLVNGILKLVLQIKYYLKEPCY